jgi:hypothetical protein
MTGREKKRPDPLIKSEVLTAALSRAAKGNIDDDLSISFRVAGGVHEQHYRLVLRTRGGRIDNCAFDCALSDRHSEKNKCAIDQKTISSLYSSLLRSEILYMKPEPPRFLPDTLVGIIEITSGENTHRVYFAADPDQAEVQGLSTPPAVLAAAEALYKTTGKILEIKNARP